MKQGVMVSDLFGCRELVQIEGLKDLLILKQLKKCVTVPSCRWKKPIPAAVILGMTGYGISNFIKMGMYVYIKKENRD